MKSAQTILKVEPKTPNVRHYTSIVSFLNDYFEYRKSEDFEFTYEDWSSELGFSSSSFMYLVCKGRRTFTTKTAKKIIPYLGLNETQEKHVLLLAHLSQSQASEMRNILLEKIIENLELPEMRLMAKNYKDFILSSTMPLIRMILSYDDCEGTENELIELLNISPTQLSSDLLRLEQMGLIQKTPQTSTGMNVWRATSKAIKFSEDSMKDVLDIFNDQNLRETIDKLKCQKLYKKMRSLVLSISPHEYQILENEIEQFANKLKNRFCVNLLDQKHLLKFHMQTYQASHIKNSKNN